MKTNEIKEKINNYIPVCLAMNSLNDLKIFGMYTVVLNGMFPVQARQGRQHRGVAMHRALIRLVTARYNYVLWSEPWQEPRLSLLLKYIQWWALLWFGFYFTSQKRYMQFAYK